MSSINLDPYQKKWLDAIYSPKQRKLDKVASIKIDDKSTLQKNNNITHDMLWNLLIQKKPDLKIPRIYKNDKKIFIDFITIYQFIKIYGDYGKNKSNNQKTKNQEKYIEEIQKRMEDSKKKY